MEKPSMIKPALIGGVILGLLSVVPILSLANCCCLWVLAGGALAARIYIRDSLSPITSGNGAAVGALAGFVGSIINSVITTTSFVVQTQGDPQKIADLMFAGMRNQQVPPVVKIYIQVAAQHFLLLLFGMSLFTLLSYIAMGAVGGIIGVSLFEKRKGQMPPPPDYPYSPPPVPPPPPYPPYPPPGPGMGNPPQA